MTTIVIRLRSRSLLLPHPRCLASLQGRSEFCIQVAWSQQIDDFAQDARRSVSRIRVWRWTGTPISRGIRASNGRRVRNAVIRDRDFAALVVNDRYPFCTAVVRCSRHFAALPGHRLGYLRQGPRAGLPIILRPPDVRTGDARGSTRCCAGEVSVEPNPARGPALRHSCNGIVAPYDLRHATQGARAGCGRAGPDAFAFGPAFWLWDLPFYSGVIPIAERRMP